MDKILKTLWYGEIMPPLQPLVTLVFLQAERQNFGKNWIF